MRPRLVALQLLLGAAAAFAPLLDSGGSRAILLLGIPASLLFPLAWLGGPDPRRERWDRPGGRSTRLRQFAGLYLIPAATLLGIAAVRTRRCEIGDGVAMLLLGHLPGLLVSFGLAELAATRRRPRRFYVAGWLLGLAVAGATLYTQPTLRTGDPFVGMLLSSLYERPRVLSPLAAGFAAESLLLAATLLGLAGVASRPPAGGHGGWLIPAAALLALHLAGPSLGLRIDRGTLHEELPREIVDGTMTHRMSRFVPTDARPWLVLDAALAWERGVHDLGLAPGNAPRPLLYWYDGSGQSRTLTGAGHRFTHPWHAEAHLIASAFPAPSLAHELAHLAAAPVVDNLAGVPGRLQGAWMNPALTEGIAVAIAWGDDPVSPHETARLAMDEGRLPPLAALFHPTGFLTHNLSIAYDVSGSFLRFCIDTTGPGPVTAWLRTLDFEESFGHPMAEREEAWRAMLSALPPLEEDVLPIVEAQEKPPIAAEGCDGGKRALELQRARATLAWDEAERIQEGEVEKGEPRAWLGLWRDRARRARYRIVLPAALPAELPPLDRERFAVLGALVAWAQGGAGPAELAFAALPGRMQGATDVVVARTLARDGYSIDDLRGEPAVDEATRLRTLWERDHHPVVGALVARGLRASARWRSLEQVTEGISWDGFTFPGDHSAALPLETLLWQGEAAFALRAWDRAEAAFRRYGERATSSGRKAHAEVWLARTAWFRQHAPPLEADLPAFPRGGGAPADCDCR